MEPARVLAGGRVCRGERLRSAPCAAGEAVTPTPLEAHMRIRLSDDRRAALTRSLQQFFRDEFDEEISAFRAEELLDFFVEKLGPSVYNQGVRDAAGFIQERLTDLEGEVYEPEPR